MFQRTVVTLVSLMVQASLLSGQWAVGTVQDPATFNDVPAAITRAAGGHLLGVFLLSDGAIAGVFRLAVGDPDFLDSGRPPVLQVDDGPRLQATRLAGELKSVSFLLWAEPGPPTHGLIREMLDGQQLRIAYPLAGGGFKEALVALQGAADSIASGLNVTTTVDAASLELANERNAAAEVCLAETKAKTREKCFKALGECLDRAPMDAAALRACLSQAP